MNQTSRNESWLSKRDAGRSIGNWELRESESAMFGGPEEGGRQMWVRVGEDIEGAIRQLKKLMGRDGVLREIQRRVESPNLTDRKKQKARLALRRKFKIERRKAWRENGH